MMSRAREQSFRDALFLRESILCTANIFNIGVCVVRVYASTQRERNERDATQMHEVHWQNCVNKRIAII